MCCLDVGSDMKLQSLQAAAFRAVSPGSGNCSPSLFDARFLIRHNGKVLGPSRTSGLRLSDLGFQEFDVLEIVPSLRGGGGDGGSTCAESRSCYLEMYAKKKPAKVDRQDEVFAKWTNCRLSAEALSPPCVVDKLGNVLNKEAVLKALQNKSIPGGLRHIRGLKDVMDVKLTEIPSVSEDALVRFHCPISGLEFNGNFRFFVMRCCGNVISQRALKELKSKSSCPMCFATVDAADRTPIYGTQEEVEELRKLMDDERARAKAEKKKEKDAAKAASVSASAGTGAASEDTRVLSSEMLERSPGEKDTEKLDRKVGSLVKKGAAASAASSDALKSQKREGEKLSSQAKRYKAPEHAPAGATKEVYASIFISSRKEEFKETYSCRSLPLGRN